jgi:endo-1,4-beta-xylanase
MTHADVSAPSPRRRARTRVLLGVTATIVVAAGLSVQGVSNAATTLKALADARGFKMGMAIDANRINNDPYRTIVNDESNSVTPGNEMKWETTEPSRGQFNFAPGDAIVSYAQGQGKSVRGHTLVWHSQLAGWVNNITTGAELLTVMRDHIAGVAGHYAGKVVDWDVVNEPFNDDGTRRQSIFQQRIGDTYIAEALRAAKAADPTAKLYLNDYNIDGVNAKSTAMFNLVSSLKSQGVPLDGVGIQGHLILNQVPGDMQQNIARFANLGLEVKITELDIRMNTPADSTKLAQQSSDYTRVFNACLAVSGCKGITVWGVGEPDSWIPSTFPGQGEGLLYDSNYAKKPAYDAVTVALGGSVSSPSPSVSPTTTSPSPSTSPSSGGGSPGACRVTYGLSAWNTGFTANVTVANTGSTAINSWALVFTLPSGQAITSGWNATYAPTSGQVTARNLSYNATINASGSVGIGFNASHTGNTSAPTSFTLNGTACTIG